jgi:ElaB/YqjD/DUF883 family membrane-anchored ribosome-binding protein
MGKTYSNRIKRTCKQNDFMSQMQDLEPKLRSMMINQPSYNDLIAETSALTIDFNVPFPNEFGESEGEYRLRCYDNYKSVKQSIEQLLASTKPLTAEFKKFDWVMMAVQIEINDHKRLFQSQTEQELKDVLTSLTRLCINRMYEITHPSNAPFSQPVSSTIESNIMNAQTSTTAADQTNAAPLTDTSSVNNQPTQENTTMNNLNETIDANSKASVTAAEEVLNTLKGKTEQTTETVKEAVAGAAETVEEKVTEATTAAKEAVAEKKPMSMTAKVLIGAAGAVAAGLAGFYGFKYAKAKGIVGSVVETAETTFDNPVVGG